MYFLNIFRRKNGDKYHNLALLKILVQLSFSDVSILEIKIFWLYHSHRSKIHFYKNDLISFYQPRQTRLQADQINQSEKEIDTEVLIFIHCERILTQKRKEDSYTDVNRTFSVL